MRIPVLLLCALLATACSTLDVKPNEQALDPAAKWAVLPIMNHTETPQAGLSAEAIAQALLFGRGVADIERYPAELNPDTVFEPAGRKAVDAALEWAQKTNVRYALTGSVDEWRYKVGLDGEPAVGLTLKVIDVKSGAVVWSGVGAASGWSRETISAVAQKLQRKMFGSIVFTQAANARSKS